MQYVAPLWLPGGNLQTIWPALYARRVDAPLPAYRRERWSTPDGDFIDVDFLDAAGFGPKPLLVLFHGLEGSSKSHYAEAFAAFAMARGWDYAVPHFRGCSGELNLAPRAYHSGDYEEIGWILGRLHAQHGGPERSAGPPQTSERPLGGQRGHELPSVGAPRSAGPPQASERPLGGQRGHEVPSVGAPIFAAGVSLGGNALLRWTEEAGDEASKLVSAVASISAPLDLTAGGMAIGRGFNRLVYTRMFLSTMKPKALAKLAQHPGLFDRDKLIAAQDLYAFDNVFTAPLHGFRDTDDYWARGSAKPNLHGIRIPALVVNATNDPFVPAASLPRQSEVGRHVTLWQPAHGGHVGFPLGAPPGHVRGMPERVGGWLAQHLSA
jgi:predicted alpha/beta-fold hydrolase